MTDSSEAIPKTDSQAPCLDRSEVSSAAMPIGRAQVSALVIAGVFALFALLPHVLLWGIPEASFWVSPGGALLSGGLFIAGVVVHEGLHGLGYVWAGADWPEIEFGFSWTGFAPYAHCRAPLRCGSYRWAIALPGLVLGVAPLTVGLSTGHWGVTLFAFVMLAAAGGDALLLWMLRDVPKSAWVQDHPRKMGALLLGHSSSEAAPRLDFDLEVNTQESEGSGTRVVRWMVIILIVSAVVGGVIGFVAASL